MEVKHANENILDDLKYTLEKHHRFFQDIPKGIHPFIEHEGQIELILGSTPNKKGLIDILHINIKGRLRKWYETLLDPGIIQPRRSYFSTLIVMVRIKDNAWRMCLD